MNNYDVEMLKGPGYDPNVRIRLETKERQLLDLIMSAIDQTYELWYNGSLSGDGRVKVTGV